MDQEKELMLKEELVLQELANIRAKLKIVRLFKSEQQREISSPSSAMSQDENVGTNCSEQTKVNPEPSSNKGKSVSIPEQTATGKESTNPLMANILPKDMNEVQTSLTLATKLIKDSINLRPNGGIQIPQIGVISVEGNTSEKGIPIPDKKSIPYYVVFNGPNAGIYDNWEITKQATEGISNIKHKKFKSFLEAKTASNIYCREHLLPEMHLIDNAQGLKPNTFAKALQSRGKTQVLIGKLPQKKVPKEKEMVETYQLDISHFEYLYQHGRLSGEEKVVEEKMFTSDGKNISYFNFIKGADPEQVAEAFNYGLVKMIYPSQNLKEISQFPKDIYKAVKSFRTKVLKNDKDIFLKINSSIPLWDEDQVLVYAPHHVIQIGVSNGEKYSPAKASSCQMKKQEFFIFGLKKLEDFLNKAFSFTKDDKIFINSVSKDHLVYSKNLKAISSEDERKILAFQHNFCNGTYMSHHDKRVCPIVRKKTSHYCLKCDPANGDPTIKDSGDSTKEKAGSSAQDDKGQKQKDNT